MRVVSLHRYPVKGCYREDLDTADVEPWGLRGDRRWLIVDTASGKGLTQREAPLLTRIRPATVPGGLVLRSPGKKDLDVAEPAGEARTVQVHRDFLKGVTAPAASGWLSELLDRDVWLAWLADPTQRPVDPQYARADDRVSFADGYPLLLTSMASLGALNAELDEPLPMNRFRPNVVVDGEHPWAEDDWQRLRIGDLPFRGPKDCARCVVTTTDQETGERGREPLRTLGRIRKLRHGLLFGRNLIPDATGTLSVGDPLAVSA
ncbi:molybdenum cofactor biosysynthesis protein [Virgisporangium aliadipatigenens]|uniref:Molybdenum cofactor biosysynthesis protein n=1 Tax=Virgisporangium aliadipatigenens TaxID=741659 RepID=A0A8J3YV49_9ACTN|nr:MOSC N-terminal beta barrel domain-containing protein [Virgisporangium aliadipatigenens]GIJ52126.1 molybdenum cofactor biosysynthesis protein [Virgisporangium aliadipatigenens]